MSTTIVALSDTHNFHRQLEIPFGDILIHAGDAADLGTKEEIEDFLGWFSNQPHKHKIYVPGNHDNPLENPDYEYFQRTGVILLWDKEVQLEGLRLYGSPYRVVPEERFYQKKSSKSRYSAFMITETWADLVWREIPSELDILVTHMPPYGILDKNREICWGSLALLNHVKRTQPKYHIFGHIHDEYGLIHNGNTTFANVSICDEYKQPIRKPVVLTL